MICSDGIYREALVEIKELAQRANHRYDFRKLEMANEPALDVWIAQSLPKSDKMETVIQKMYQNWGDADLFPLLLSVRLFDIMRKRKTKRIEDGVKLPRKRPNRPTAIVSQRSLSR